MRRIEQYQKTLEEVAELTQLISVTRNRKTLDEATQKREEKYNLLTLLRTV